MLRLRTLSLALLLMVAAFAQAQSDTYNGLLVNEICVANLDQEIDPSYNYGGWIELYNSGEETIALNSIYISDNTDDPYITRLTGSIEPKAFLRLWFDHNSADGTYGNTAAKQIRFKMDADGGTLYFHDNKGTLLFEQSYPTAIARCSYCRVTDGASTWAWTAKPTPEASNNDSEYAAKRLPAPVVDQDSQLFTGTLTFNVEIPEGATLRYTTDGTTPMDGKSAISGDGVFTASSTKVYRFRLFQEGFLPSAVVTRSFIYNNKNYYLPVVSVVTDRANLYDSKIGCYTVGTNGVSGRGTGKSNKNMDWERPVNFDYIVDGQGVLSQECTFEVCGGWSRHNAISSFKLKAQKQYEGKNFLPYPFFSQKPYIKNKVVMLRNGGNDFSCRTKDAMLQHIALSSDLYVDGQSYNPCHVFINGNYLTMLNMREPSNKHYAYANYGIDTDMVDAFELSPDSNPKLAVKAGSATMFNEWYSKSYDAKTESTYDEIIDKYVDIDEFINYYAVETWLGSWDWLTNNNNTKGFRAWDNGRFHFVLFDLDAGLDATNMLSQLKGSTANKLIILFNRMATNERFKRQFVTAYCMVSGSIFTPERAQASADYIGSLTEKALGMNNQSPWGSCNDVISKLKDNNARRARLNSLKNYFSLGSSVNISASANIPEAEIEINGMLVPTRKFDGEMFPPFTLSATAPAGYNFVGWQTGTSTQRAIFGKTAVWSYYDNGSLDGKDWKTGDVSGWRTGNAPLGYGQTVNTKLSYGGNSSSKRPTYYFRKTINLNDEPTANDRFVLDYTVDDGFILYVNGIEAGRHLMAPGEAKYSDYATTYCEGNPDNGQLVLDNSLLHSGNNFIAVEVHNNSGTSSDILWSAALTLFTNTGDKIFADRTIEVAEASSNNTTYTALFEPIPQEYLLEAGQTPVVINEISASNDVFINEYFKKNDWIELYNTTSSEIDVAGMFLTDDASKPTKYQIPGDNPEINTIIPAHGHLVIWADKLDPLYQLHTTFKLGNNDGELVMLSAEDLSWSNTLKYDKHLGTESVGRYPDGGRRVYRMSLPTVGKRNQLTTYAAHLYGEDINFNIDDAINEVQADKSDPFAPGIAASTPATKLFNLNGIEIAHPQRGVNIIRTEDGRTRKLLMK